ncbi:MULTISPECIES: NlpC/P60 family protein [unclassified Saccharopolyspora]|uniref:NlpC/P60 family protein n=1 Tax=unclassified Saccharopolyspora TaxID=2646250 RepID=UPI001CD599BB|nr:MULTISPECIES: NlpC/P60 family protein [unclassified Saccharopolyspora]MCA1185578.1 NlpC/P60 family protein [Saccharopolyspora sp. 6T]MCA1191565.1 NlpC/P60 family protein [Saccharopolyspora sp. 6V]MCA1226333.1 NlpC/P60 family protein [Saccharopolyspora sp. 6M]MCA1280796.1 NlpC/P60 family protein [Saccharopolyspora sp. 7B]
MRRPRLLPGGLVLASAFALALPLAAAGAPDPPARPDDGEIQTQRDRVGDRADRVGELTQRLSEAETRLTELSARVELAMEDANKARVDLDRAELARSRAEQTAAGAQGQANAAADEVERQRARLDEFAAGSYRQGSKLGSLTAYVGARGPDELLERAELLDTVGRTQLDVLDDLERSRIDRVNKDSLAREALQEAAAARATAAEAKGRADTAQQAAIAARASQASTSARLEAERSGVQQELTAARAAVRGLESQRDRYEEWLKASQAAQAQQAAEAQAAAGNAQGSPAPDSDDDTEVATGSVETVVRRALSQLGMPYAWGGGNSSGPTRGIRDGGVADSYGDYQKIGFDCSGLMIYAFAGAGVQLDHYSGYQYQSGTQVPLSSMQRGDMLFWRSGGRVHHVALYLGGGRMVEAPYSGSKVRVTSVRYAGIAPYAVRLL